MDSAQSWTAAAKAEPELAVGRILKRGLAGRKVVIVGFSSLQACNNMLDILPDSETIGLLILYIHVYPERCYSYDFAAS